MSATSIIHTGVLTTAAILLFLAPVCYVLTTVERENPTQDRIAGNSQADTDATAALYSKLRTSARVKLGACDVAEEALDNLSGQLEELPFGGDFHQRARTFVRRGRDLVARQRTTLQHIADGDYEFPRALAESEKMNSESIAFLAEVDAIHREMLQIHGESLKVQTRIEARAED
jgi:hypothetical protein